MERELRAPVRIPHRLWLAGGARLASLVVCSRTSTRALPALHRGVRQVLSTSTAVQNSFAATPASFPGAVQPLSWMSQAGIASPSHGRKLVCLRNYAPGSEAVEQGRTRLLKMKMYGFQFSSVQSLSRVRLFVTPWTAACQASLSITNSWSLPILMSNKSVMPSNHLMLCHPLLLLPSVFPSIRVFSNESALRIRWPKYWSLSFSISPSNEYSGLISFRMDWLDLLAVQGTLKSLLQHHSSKALILQCLALICSNYCPHYPVILIQLYNINPSHLNKQIPQASQMTLVVKNLPINARDIRDLGSVPGLGRSPSEGNSNPPQYSCLENPMDRGAWQAAVHRIAKSWTWLRWLSMHANYTHTHTHTCAYAHAHMEPV